ncbi:MAG: nitroreductase family protein [Patescibacteria group bacterium]|nr:nitroreductase family protein [Patescibacteria group bacterium]
MDVTQAIRERRSIRRYKADPVPEEKLNKILEAARLAPSAHNAQDWKFIVVRNTEIRKKISIVANQSFIAEAPVVIAAVALNPKSLMSCEVPAYAVDLAIAVEHMALQATAEGLGACWIGSFDQKKVEAILKVPEKYKIVALLPIGVPDETPAAKPRKNITEIVCWEKFS